MIDKSRHARDPAVESFFLGPIDFETCLALQQRLVFEAGGRNDGQISLLICEHPAVITVGRLGSRAHIRLSPRELASRQLEVRWVNRGGGCLLHAPGQLAIYPIVPLTWHAWSVGEYLARLERGILATLAELGIEGQIPSGAQAGRGVWGRSGQLAAFGVAVKSWTTYFGAYINVDPKLQACRSIDSDPLGGTPVSSLAAERRRPVKMPTVRATIVRHLAEALGCPRYHLYTGHPLAAELLRTKHESAGRLR
jgi:lipoyl(octanoyl) transferase